MSDAKLCGKCSKPKEDDDACQCGRPTKLTDAFLAVAKQALTTGEDVLILTDEELLLLINDKLPENDQVALRTFESWKALAQSDGDLDPIFVEFLRLLKKGARSREAKPVSETPRGREGMAALGLDYRAKI